MSNTYFIVDGSSLLADAKKVRTTLNVPHNARLHLSTLADYYVSRTNYLHDGLYRRFVYYFVQNDQRLPEAVVLPEPEKPERFKDLRVEYCGKRIPQLEQAKEWLDNNAAPEFVTENLYRSEKAVDTQICCDALQLAAVDKLDRLFLYTNDFDFVPLCRTLRQLGVNINLLRLRASSVNLSLASECDGIHELNDDEIRACFNASLQ